MQHKIYLLLFATIAVLFVEGTTTKSPTTTGKKKLPAPTK
jgi:hypothetical protein